jgi:putative Ca2+/H+ antiporter (TMEM165/GDT1 family)
MRQLITIFVTVFLAELGDKTQLATMLFATDQNIGKVQVFVAAAAALVMATLVAVIAGDLLARVVSPATLQLFAGLGLILIGFWIVLSVLR